MTATFGCDISEYQPVVDDSYTRRWLSFRLCFAGRIDNHAAANLAWCVKARAAGRIDGFTGYVVPQPGSNDAIMAAVNSLKFPADAVVMIDGEKWNGTSYQINGDHSAEFNQLAMRLRVRQGNRPDLVWAYGNRGPDLEVWPRKAPWLGWVVASYGGDQPVEKNAVGWQYTDGEPAYDHPDRPSSTPPFGRCDHNVFFKLPEGDDMPTAKEIAEAVWDLPLTDSDGKRQPASAWVKQARNLSDPKAVAALILSKLPDDAGGLTKQQVQAAVDNGLSEFFGKAVGK
jgi:hypothetical protein